MEKNGENEFQSSEERVVPTAESVSYFFPYIERERDRKICII